MFTGLRKINSPPPEYTERLHSSQRPPHAVSRSITSHSLHQSTKWVFKFSPDVPLVNFIIINPDEPLVRDSCDYRNVNHVSHQQQSSKIQPTIKDQMSRGNSRSSSTVSLSLDRRRRRLRNRNDRDQRARSQSDLLYCDHERSMLPHYCSLQQFQCHYGSNPYMNYYNNNTEVYEQTSRLKIKIQKHLNTLFVVFQTLREHIRIYVLLR